MSAKRIAIVGGSGRMGQEIAQICHTEKIPFYIVDRSKPDREGKKWVKKISDLQPRFVDVVIEFSSPEGFLTTAKWCFENKIALVSGTTGLEEKHREAIKECSKKAPVLWAPNMSVGVAITKKLVEKLAMESDFDIQVLDIHHGKKKDAPSGTASLLQNAIESSRKSVSQPLSIRGGGVPGIHTVYAMSEDEMITIEHTAFNRRVFARGAVRAALWVSKKRSGLYGVEDTIRSPR